MRKRLRKKIQKKVRVANRKFLDSLRREMERSLMYPIAGKPEVGTPPMRSVFSAKDFDKAMKKMLQQKLSAPRFFSAAAVPYPTGPLRCICDECRAKRKETICQNSDPTNAP